MAANDLEPTRQRIVTRDPAKGTQVTLLKDVPGFEEASKVYQPGEFWVSYCDGNQSSIVVPVTGWRNGCGRKGTTWWRYRGWGQIRVTKPSLGWQLARAGFWSPSTRTLGNLSTAGHAMRA